MWIAPAIILILNVNFGCDWKPEISLVGFIFLLDISTLFIGGIANDIMNKS